MTTESQQILDSRPPIMSTGSHSRLFAHIAGDLGYKIRDQIITKGASPILLAVLIAACCGVAQAQERPARQFNVFDLPSLGGTISRGNSINDQNWAAGYSNLPGNDRRHAALWRSGSILDLGTLGGPNSSVAWPVKNTRGAIAGIAQTAMPDPLGERWSCSFFFPGPNNAGYTCLGFVWENGVMRSLPTLGGNNGFAAGANNRGQVTGWAENTVHDPTCVPPQVLQFRPVVWGPGNQIHQLPLIPGDTSGAATAINDRGQAVGISGICDQAVGRHTAKHAVLWENGRVTDIGNIGGDTWNTPMAINQRGDIVGFLGQAGDPDGNFIHAFLWTRRGGIQDLGTLRGDVSSQANGINERRQVVGSSCDADGNCRAFLWENGVMKELKKLVAPGYVNLLINGQDINDSGWITGRALNPDTGELPAFLAIPSCGDDEDDKKDGLSMSRSNGVQKEVTQMLPGTTELQQGAWPSDRAVTSIRLSLQQLLHPR